MQKNSVNALKKFDSNKEENDAIFKGLIDDLSKNSKEGYGQKQTFQQTTVVMDGRQGSTNEVEKKQ